MRELSEKHTARVLGLYGVVIVKGNEARVQVIYRRYSKLGEALSKNLRQERAILANYMRQELALPRGANATYFEFVGI
jgi:hypothetical protein